MKTTNNNSNGRQRRPISNGVKKTCKKYEMDLMHYASGEYNYIKDRSALETHLKTCPVCQKVLRGFVEVDTFAAVTRPPSRQFQEKMADLRQRAQKGLPAEAPAQAGPPPSYAVPKLRSGEGQPLPPKQKTPIDAHRAIISAAGELYNLLKEHGELPIPVIRDRTGLVDFPFYEAMGWLAGQEKILLNRETNYASFNPGG